MLELSASSWMSAPRIRVSTPWVLTARCCSNIDAHVNFSTDIPVLMSSSVEYRTQIAGVWSDWADVPAVDAVYPLALTLQPVLANQCISIQFRGEALVIGEFIVAAFWNGSSDEDEFDGTAATAYVTFRVVESVVTVPAQVDRIQGVSCLGVGTYDARVVARKTPTSAPYVIGELEGYSGNWARLLNTTSEASMRFALTNEQGLSTMVDPQGHPSECCEVIRKIQPWRHELELYRTSTVRSSEMVWAGPITDVATIRKSDEVTVSAKDLSAWWQLRKMAQTFESRQIDLATIFEHYVNYSRIADDYGLVVQTEPTGVLGDRTVTGSDYLTLGDELNELDRTGVDWTICNRTGFFGGQSIGGINHIVPTILRDESFRDAPDIRRTGIDQGNEWFVKGASGIIGHFGGADSDGVLIQRSKTEFGIEDQNSANAAARTAWERSHDPLVYVQGDNALDPQAEIDIQELVCGVLIPFDLTGGGCVPYGGQLRLERVSTNFTPGSEEVSIYCQPIGSDGSTDG